MNKIVNKTKKGFWGVFVFYFLVAFEFAYMAGPFAIYFYSVYSPVLIFFNKIPALSWTIKFFLPHVVRTTESPVINAIEVIGIVLSVTGFLIFVIGACQIYYSKLAKKGAVLGGLYTYIRHPQYTSFIVCSFGLLLLWPRYIVIFFFVTLLFGYYFLARAEEKECEEKFGESYIEYEKRTGRFFPRFTKVPQKNIVKKFNIAKIIIAYILTLALFYAGAAGLNMLTIQSLYSVTEEKSVTVSLCKNDNTDIENIYQIAKSNPEVAKILEERNQSGMELNYILPTEWLAAEIPMNGYQYKKGHKSNQDYDKTKYKIIFEEPILSEGTARKGNNILLHTTGIRPFIEVWVDTANQSVTDILEMPSSVKYDGIPEAIY